MLPLNQRNLPLAATVLAGVVACQAAIRHCLHLSNRYDRRAITRAQPDPFERAIAREIEQQLLERRLQTRGHRVI